MLGKIGRYEIKDELGRGGMATVYHGHDPRFQRDVAIKVLPRQFMHEPRFLERFEQEARTIAALEHFAIVPVYDFGEEDDAPYLVMRYMAGGSLRVRMSGEPLWIGEVSHILERLSKALDKAHERGIIHRDLKPGNVLFDEDGQPYLADFGIARMAEATQTMTVIGTPAYMSPEQVQGQVKLDWRSDIYALGVMLFEMLTGKQPFEAETPTGQMFMHVMEPVPDVLTINTNLPSQTQAVINKAMAKDRAERFQSASELYMAVKELVNAAPQAAKPAAAAAATTIVETDMPTASHTPGEELEPVTVIDTAVPSEAQPPPPPSSPAAPSEEQSGLPAWLWWAGGLFVVIALVIALWLIFAENGGSGSEPAQSDVEGLEAKLTAEAAPEELYATEAGEATKVAAAAGTVESELPPEPVTLNWSWRSEPETLDPVLETTVSGIDVMHNLFMPLVRIDPETGAVLPHLATEWSMSDDGYEHTFKLREDVPWVIYDPNSGEWKQALNDSGDPWFVTAHDIVYGVRRTADPTMKSPWIAALDAVKNAREVFSESKEVTFEEIGVEALDDHTVRFTLNQAAPYFPAAAADLVFSAQPDWAIEAWGDSWTFPGRIVTNGPYGLAEWTDGGRLDLLKNPLWPDAGQVQIEAVNSLVIPDAFDAISIYKADDLDGYQIPGAEFYSLVNEPDVGPQMIHVPAPCTYYYGFTNNKPPFDDVRVRTAFVQAIDRQALVDQVVLGGQSIATSFGAPGVFGAPDPGLVGLSFDADAARDSLQLYLNEEGMTAGDLSDMDIVLMHPKTSDGGHAAAASAVQQMWQENLGVNVRVQEQDWSDYLITLNNDTPLAEMPHIWRLGYCAFYADQHGMLARAFHIEPGQNRLRRNCVDEMCTEETTSEFDELITRAAEQTDPEIREQMYEDAERILAIDEAAYIPLYHYTSSHLVKPWLSRNYPHFGGEDFWNWQIDQETQLGAQRE